jgi:hypothetical protein
MRRPISILFVLFTFVIGAAAQTQPSATPVSTPDPRIERERMAREQRDQWQRLSNLRAISSRKHLWRDLPRTVYNEVRDLYRDPTEKELKALQPLTEDLMKHAEFLRHRGTGIVRMVEDAGCGDTTKTVSAADRCLEYSMPGNGASYSFRIPNYRIRRLADLHYANGNFTIPGIMQHGLLTGIGDVPLDSPLLLNRVPEPVKQFRAVSDLSKAHEVDEKHHYGWREGDLYFGKMVRAVGGMTYILRSVAYDGKYHRSVGGVVYNELEFDKRADVTIAFRIVRWHDDGSITILWKELSRQAVPKLILAEKNEAKIKKEEFQAN